MPRSGAITLFARVARVTHRLEGNAVRVDFSFRPVRYVIAGTVIAAVLPALGLQPAAASTLTECAGTYSLVVPNSTPTNFVTISNPDNASGTCIGETVNGSSLLAVSQPGPWSSSNPVSYTGDCVEGTVSYGDGGGGVFLFGLLVVTNPSHTIFVATLTPPSAPCTGAQGSTLTWSGPANYDPVTP